MPQVLFQICVYKDQELARARIAELRSFYGATPIQSISDGVRDDTYAKFCFENSVLYYIGDRLKLVKFAGAWTVRRLRLFLQSDADLCVKIDPDTKVCAKVERWPRADLFGHKQEPPAAPLHGGCLGITREAAQKIIDSRLLLAEHYTDLRFGYRRFHDEKKPGEMTDVSWVACEDRILEDLVPRLHLTTADLPEAYCVSGSVPRYPPAGKAFLHPWGALKEG